MSEREYQELCYRVERIDPDAAEYLRGEGRTLSGFTTSGDLREVFLWEATKQGREYWQRIQKELEWSVRKPDTCTPVIRYSYDMKAASERFDKLMEFKAEHCPDKVWEHGAANYSIHYNHTSEMWESAQWLFMEHPSEVYLDKTSAEKLSSMLNSGEFVF